MQLFMKPGQRWYKSGGRVWSDQGYVYQLDGRGLFPDPAPLLTETKATPFNGGYLLNRKPKRPLWEYTVFAPFLRALGAAGVTFTTNAITYNSRASYVALLLTQTPFNWSRVSSEPKTTILFAAGDPAAVIKVSQSNGNTQAYVYYSPELNLTNLTTIESLAPDNPNCVVQSINQKLLGERVSSREEQVATLRYELNALLGQAERQKAALNQAILELDAVRLSEATAPDASNLTPQITSLRIINDRLVVTTVPLIAKIESDGVVEQFSLGPLALVIPVSQWSRVTCLPIGIGPAPHSHPHANGACICLGNTFTRTAVALQDRGELVLYLNLLIDHLQNGVDPNDSLGCRVIMWPESPAGAAHEME